MENSGKNNPSNRVFLQDNGFYIVNNNYDPMTNIGASTITDCSSSTSRHGAIAPSSPLTPRSAPTSIFATTKLADNDTRSSNSKPPRPNMYCDITREWRKEFSHLFNRANTSEAVVNSNLPSDVTTPAASPTTTPGTPVTDLQ